MGVWGYGRAVGHGLCVQVNEFIVKIELFIVVIDKILIDNLIDIVFSIVNEEAYIGFTDAVKVLSSFSLREESFINHVFSDRWWVVVIQIERFACYRC